MKNTTLAKKQATLEIVTYIADELDWKYNSLKQNAENAKEAIANYLEVDEQERDTTALNIERESLELYQLKIDAIEKIMDALVKMV